MTVDDVYNIPRVIDVTGLLKDWVYDASHGQRLKDTPIKQIPEIVRRFTQDIYMCVYVNPDLDMYGDDSANSNWFVLDSVGVCSHIAYCNFQN